MKNGIPRYFLRKTLKTGEEAYYWSPPIYDGMVNGPRRKALGADFAAAIEEAERMNAVLDAWRKRTPTSVRKAMAKRLYHRVNGKPEAVRRRGWVYIVESDGFIKIGFTANLNSRMAQINTCAPHGVTLLHKFKGTDLDEYDLHSALAEHRHRLEWFRNVPAVTAFVENLKIARSE